MVYSIGGVNMGEYPLKVLRCQAVFECATSMGTFVDMGFYHGGLPWLGPPPPPMYGVVHIMFWVLPLSCCSTTIDIAITALVHGRFVISHTLFHTNITLPPPPNQVVPFVFV